MSESLQSRARHWLKFQSHEKNVFDWFALFMELCGFHGLCADLCTTKQSELRQAGARLWQRYGELMQRELDLNLDALPREVEAAMTAELERVSTLDSCGPAQMIPLLGWVVFLDGLFVGLGSTLRSDSSERVSSARIRLSERRNLTSASTDLGYVIPKARHGEYGAEIFGLLTSLTHCPPSPAVAINYAYLDEPTGWRCSDGLNVAIVTCVQAADEITWRFDTAGDAPTFEATLDEASEQIVIDRVIASMSAVGDRAHLVLLPELVSSERLNSEISRWLSDTRSAGRMLPVAVLAGTYLVREGENPPLNTATLFTGDGRSALVQHKLNRYTLLSKHHRDLKLPGADPNIDYVENLTTAPREIHVLDISGLGRVVVAICEDNARWNPWREVLRPIGPNLCLAPIMNGHGNHLRKWIVKDAIDATNEVGSMVIVANSGAMTRAGIGDPSDYAIATFPKNQGVLTSWGDHIDSGDVDNDGRTDWWLYRCPESDH